LGASACRINQDAAALDVAAAYVGQRLPSINILIILPLRGIEWVILAWFRGSVFFGPILLFDRHHPSIPTCTRYLPARAAAVKDGPPSGHRVSGAKRP